MDMSNPLFILFLSVGLIFIIVGFIQYNYPPKNINHIYGYRLKSSMKSQERWNFAQKYSSKFMIFNGLFLIICSYIAYFFKFNDVTSMIIGITIIIVCIFALIFMTEKAIKRKFIK
jgi:uncharacterized membrane protein